MFSENQKNTTPLKDPNTAIQDVMDSINLLRDIYAQENDALNSANTNAFLSLQEQKLEAARSYQLSVEHILNRRDEIKTAHPQKKADLVQMQMEFSKLSETNKEILLRMQRCVDRLGGTIRNAAREAIDKQRGQSYGECGTLKTSARSKAVSTGGINETA